MLSIVTWNTLAQRYVDPHLSTRYPYVSDHSILSWDYRIRLIRTKLLNLDPDIICLQEVELSTIETDFVTFFADNGYNSFHHTINKNRTNPIGNITLWKKSLFTCENKDINSCGLFTMLVSTLPNDDVNDTKKIQISNIHLKAGLTLGKERVPQLNSCIKRRMNKDIPNIICGDFNDLLEDGGLLKNILSDNNYKCHVYENTCSVFNEQYQSSKYWPFDHIATSDINVTILSCGITQNIPNENEPSDHILVQFAVPIFQSHLKLYTKC